MILKVSSKSNPNSVAGAIAGMFDEEEHRVEIQAVGAGAVNQAIKSIIIAKGFMAPKGLDVVINPSFKTVEIDGIERTAIRLVVEVR